MPYLEVTDRWGTAVAGPDVWLKSGRFLKIPYLEVTDCWGTAVAGPDVWLNSGTFLKIPYLEVTNRWGTAVAEPNVWLKSGRFLKIPYFEVTDHCTQQWLNVLLVIDHWAERKESTTLIWLPGRYCKSRERIQARPTVTLSRDSSEITAEGGGYVGFHTRCSFLAFGLM